MRSCCLIGQITWPPECVIPSWRRQMTTVSVGSEHPHIRKGFYWSKSLQQAQASGVVIQSTEERGCFTGHLWQTEDPPWRMDTLPQQPSRLQNLNCRTKRRATHTLETVDWILWRRLRWRNSSTGAFSRYVQTTNEMYCSHLDVIPQMQEHLDSRGKLM